MLVSLIEHYYHENKKQTIQLIIFERYLYYS